MTTTTPAPAAKPGLPLEPYVLELPTAAIGEAVEELRAAAERVLRASATAAAELEAEAPPGKDRRSDAVRITGYLARAGRLRAVADALEHATAAKPPTPLPGAAKSTSRRTRRAPAAGNGAAAPEGSVAADAEAAVLANLSPEERAAIDAARAARPTERDPDEPAAGEVEDALAASEPEPSP